MKHRRRRTSSPVKRSDTRIALPTLFASKVSAGFPAPGDDTVEAQLNIHEYLVTNPTATFFVRAEGDSMRDAHIATGDILVVDRSVEARHGMIVVAAVMGELVVKRVVVRSRARFLASDNENYAPIRISEDTDCIVWGVVVGVVRKLIP